jgi:hypothetical protein
MARALLTLRDMSLLPWKFSIDSRHLWRFVLASVCPAIVLVSSQTACSAFDECTIGERRCSATGTIEECTAHPSGTDVSADGPSVSHHDSSPNTWDPQGACGSADLCKTESVKDKYGASKNDAYCVLSATPDPACASGATGCDGATSVTCRSGFAIEELLCKSCAPGSCTGNVLSSCKSDGDCAAGLFCDNDTCEMKCGCAEGAACDSCNVLDRDTVGPTRGAPYTWTCSAGKCSQSYQ